MYPKPIRKLIDIFVKFPGIGPKQAGRFVFHLLAEDEKTVAEIADAIKELKQKVEKCGLCFKSTEVSAAVRVQPAPVRNAQNTNVLCEFCRDQKRNKHLIMVVEKETDLINLERTKKFDGLYHVLGGTISPLDSSSPSRLHIKELFERIKKLRDEKQEVEITLATNPTTEGDTTALYLERVLKPLGTKITRLGRGLGTGSELEYADEITIANAFLNRK